MSRIQFPGDPPHGPDPSRRRFVRGLALGGVLAGLVPAASIAQGIQAKSAGLRRSPSGLRGTTFDLEIAETPVNFTGKPAIGTIINVLPKVLADNSITLNVSVTVSSIIGEEPIAGNFYPIAS